MEAPGQDIVRIGSLELRFLVDENDGNGGLVMFEFTMPPGARVPAPHFHEAVDEAVYALEGVTTTALDGGTHELRPGQSLLIPRGAVHTHENLHPETARALIVMTPGSIGRRYFEAVARETDRPGGPDLARVKAIMARHGLVPA